MQAVTGVGGAARMSAATAATLRQSTPGVLDGSEEDGVAVAS